MRRFLRWWITPRPMSVLWALVVAPVVGFVGGTVLASALGWPR